MRGTRSFARHAQFFDDEFSAIIRRQPGRNLAAGCREPNTVVIRILAQVDQVDRNDGEPAIPARHLNDESIWFNDATLLVPLMP
jgi:hypothetical protein